MASKLDLKSLKKRAKGQWDRRNDEYYKMVIKGLDRVTFEKVNDYMEKGWDPEKAHKQVLWDEEGNPERKAEDLGNCSGCRRGFTTSALRRKMEAGKCGHVLCSSCIEDLYLFEKAKCHNSICREELGMEDFRKWETPSEAPMQPFGFVGTMPMPKITRSKPATNDAAKAVAEPTTISPIPVEEDDDSLFIPETARVKDARV
jgi:hypothetical protein